MTKAQLLRELLASGRWYSSSELVKAGCGFRYGAVLHRVRRGEDGGPPLEVETRRVRGGLFRYRLKPKGVAK